MVERWPRWNFGRFDRTRDRRDCVHVVDRREGEPTKFVGTVGDDRDPSRLCRSRCRRRREVGLVLKEFGRVCRKVTLSLSFKRVQFD